MKKILLLPIIFIGFLASAQTDIFDPATLSTRINTEIILNNNKQITGPILNKILNGFLNIRYSYSNGLSATTSYPYVVRFGGSLTQHTAVNGLSTYDLSFNNIRNFTLSASSVQINLGSDQTGDMYMRNSLGKLIRIAPGSNGDVLTISGGIPAWSGAAGAGANNYPTSLTYSTDVLTLGRNGLSSLTASLPFSSKLNNTDTAAMLSNYITGNGYGLLKSGHFLRVDTSWTNGLTTLKTMAKVRDSLAALIGAGGTGGGTLRDIYLENILKSGFDTITHWRPGDSVVAFKAFNDNWAGWGMVDNRTVTDTTIFHQLRADTSHNANGVLTWANFYRVIKDSLTYGSGSGANIYNSDGSLSAGQRSVFLSQANSILYIGDSTGDNGSYFSRRSADLQYYGQNNYGEVYADSAGGASLFAGRLLNGTNYDGEVTTVGWKTTLQSDSLDVLDAPYIHLPQLKDSSTAYFMTVGANRQIYRSNTLTLSHSDSVRIKNAGGYSEYTDDAGFAHNLFSQSPDSVHTNEFHFGAYRNTFLKKYDNGTDQSLAMFQMESDSAHYRLKIEGSTGTGSQAYFLAEQSPSRDYLTLGWNQFKDSASNSGQLYFDATGTYIGTRTSGYQFAATPPIAGMKIEHSGDVSFPGIASFDIKFLSNNSEFYFDDGGLFYSANSTDAENTIQSGPGTFALSSISHLTNDYTTLSADTSEITLRATSNIIGSERDNSVSVLKDTILIGQSILSAIGSHIRFTRVPTSSDTTTYKPYGHDANGNLVAMNYWPAASGGSVSATWGGITGTIADQADLQTALNAKVTANSSITGATKTKITYDSKGLVTAGADATTSDIAEGSNLYHTTARVQTVGDARYLQISNNLSDVASASTARANLSAAASGSNTDITSLLLSQTGLVVKGASSNALTIKPNETLTAARTLNIVTGDASRTLTFTGNATISGTNTGDQDLSSYLTSATAASTYQPLDADLTTIAGLTPTTDNFIVSVSSAWASRTPSQVKTTLSLNNVENTALSTWAGSTNITTLGTIATGTWNGSVIGASYLPTSAADGSTKGIATFTAADFNASSGNISIDYTNGQAASGSTKGFLTSTDWSTFNNKQAAITTGTTAQYLRGDLSLATFPTNNTAFTNGAGYITNSNAYLDFTHGIPGSAPASGSTRIFSTGAGIINWETSTGLTVSIDGSAVSGSRSFSVPDLGGQLITNNSAQTISAVKTFSSAPVISSITNTGTLTLPTVTGTLVQYAENSTASSATPSPAGDARENWIDITALAAGATFAAPSGTAANHNRLNIRIKDNGTARSLAFNAIYRAGTDISLPTTTVVSKTMYLQFVYNSTDSKWDLVSKIDNL